MNPILNEIDQAHDNLSPPAQEVLRRARARLGPALPGGAAGDGVSTPTPPAGASNSPGGAPQSSPVGIQGPGRGVSLPFLDAHAGAAASAPFPPASERAATSQPAAVPASTPSGTPGNETSDAALSAGIQGAVPSSAGVIVSRETPPLQPIPLSPAGQGHVQELNRLEGSPSGISGLKHGWARIPLQIIDAIGGGLAPGIEQRIPGTQGHHEVLVSQARANVKGDEEQRRADEEANTAAATAANLESQVPLHEAQAEHARAQAGAVTHPQSKQITNELEAILAANTDLKTGVVDYEKALHDYHQRALEIEGAKHPPKDTAPKYEKIGDDLVEVTQGADGKTTTSVVYKGNPKVQTHIANIEVGGKGHQVLVNTQTGETIKDLGATGERPPVINVNQQNSRLDAEVKQYGEPYSKMIEDTSSQLEKIQEARNLVKGGAVAQALGVPKLLSSLVGGRNSGLRMTKAELDSIVEARGIKGTLESWVNRLEGKGRLTAEQVNQMGGILDDVEQKLGAKSQAARDTMSKMRNAKNREEIIGLANDAEKNFSQLEKAAGKGGGGGEVVKWGRDAQGNPVPLK